MSDPPKVPSKILIIFCDGTSNDGVVAVGSKNRRTLQGQLSGSENQYATNVLRLCRAMIPVEVKSDPPRTRIQIVHYMSGVGAESDFYGNRLWETNSMVALGTTVASKIRDAYNFLAQNYVEGDEIALFGFSRGAYTVRKVAGLIDKLGLLPVSEMGTFFTKWRSLLNSPDGTLPRHSQGRTVSIKCLGVWDTVGSVYKTIDVLRLKDDSLPGCVKHAFHALALHEDRDKFLPDLFTPRPDPKLQELVQMWFPGAHADVGGGYQSHELADIPLFWMAGEIASRDLLSIDLNMLKRCRQPQPMPWGNAYPHDSYADTEWYKGRRLLIKMKTRLEAGLITSTSLIHRSFFESTLIPKPKWDKDRFVTKKLLNDTFGPTWRPEIYALTPFEAECKKDWEKQLRTRTKNGEPEPAPTYESNADLFPDNEMGLLWVKDIRNEIPDCDIVQGGVDEDGQALFIARILHEGALYPGMTGLHLQTATSVCYGGESITESTNYEILTAPMGSYQWVAMSGPYNSDKMKGKKPVEAGYTCRMDMAGDWECIAAFVAQSQPSDDSVGGLREVKHCGWVSPGILGKQIAPQIPWGSGDSECGREFSDYLVLAYTSTEPPITEIKHSDFPVEAPTKPGNTSSRTVRIFDRGYPPSIAVGLNMLECDLNQAHFSALRFYSYADKITKSEFEAHVDAFGDSTLYAARLDTLVTDNSALQIGVFDTAVVTLDNINKRVNFPIAFNYPPQVVVALSGLDMSLNWTLCIFASNIDHRGFNMNITTMEWASLRRAVVNWIAFPQNAPGIWAGSFGTETNQSCKGHVNFGIDFYDVPEIFTALNRFEFSDTSRNMSVKVVTSNVTVTGMDWEIKFPMWPNAGSHVDGVDLDFHAEVSFLAMDLSYSGGWIPVERT